MAEAVAETKMLPQCLRDRLMPQHVSAANVQIRLPRATTEEGPGVCAVLILLRVCGSQWT